MIGTKKKLTTAAFMLVISVLMLTTASYAWFTISTNPEITDLTTQIVVNENLEIALAQTANTEPLAAATGQTGNQYTWGNIIDLSDTDLTGEGKPYTTLDKTLRPITIDTTFKYPTYGTDGRVNALENLTVGTRANGFGNLKDGAGKIYAYYVDFWMQTNLTAGGTVTLSTAVKRSTDAAALDIGGGTVFTSANQVLADNIAIAFEKITSGASANGAGTAATAAAPAGSGPYTTAFTGNVVTLTANTPELVRMYIYLEGASVTNESASLEGALLTGALNVQFALTGVDKSMDGQA
ncbi:MAG: hypothetical protein EOM54_10565 [Clostridia bacterium]|nr:hypothetical protein [Clostridia bacterium]